jgi:hypothetical protein
MVTDARTSNRNYPKPHPDNEIDDEFPRLIAALEAIDVDVAALLTSVAGKASTGALAAYQATAQKNANNGYAGLDNAGKIAAGQLPILSGSRRRRSS